MVDTIKFSEMTDGGDISNGDKTPGLLSGDNVLFNNPWTFLPSGSTADRPTPSSAINYRLRFNTTDQLYEYYDAVLGAWTQLQETAFTAGPYVIYEADAALPDAFNLGTLATGILKQTVTAGVSTPSMAINGVDYYGPGYTGYINAPAGIQDLLGNTIVKYTATASAVNYLEFINNISGQSSSIKSTGTDLNVGMTFLAKNAGQFGFYSADVSAPIQFFTGTGNQHQTYFNFFDTSATRTVLWPDASGTVAFVGSSIPSIEGTANQVLVNGTSGSPVTGSAITLTTPQDIGTASNVEFNRVRTGFMYDLVNNMPVVYYTNPSATVVNYLHFFGNETGFAPGLITAGSDTNIGYQIGTKGDAAVTINTEAVVQPYLSVNSGTLGQHTTNLFAADTAAVRNVTWPDKSGTVAFTSDLPTGAALTKTDDTNVTLTLGGSPTTALLAATSLTLGWNGQLAASRGGTGISSLGSGVATALGLAVVGSGNIVLGTSTTYTPALAFGGGSTGITYTTQTGAYTKNGATCTVQILITLSNKGSSTGSATVTLPVAVRASTGNAILTVSGQNVTAAGGIVALAAASGTSISLYNYVSGSTLSALADTAFTNTSWLFITGTYLI